MRHAALLPFGLALLAGMTAAFAQPTPSAELDRLSGVAGTRGAVRVIVGVQGTYQPEGRLTPAEAAQQRAALREAQRRLEQQLAGTQSRTRRHFDQVPASALEVDANGLARLRASPEVRFIEEDRLTRRSLLQSTALINAPTAWAGGKTGTDWSVAVLDTGVDSTHPFLAGKVVAEACFSSNTSESSSVCPGGVAQSTAAGSGRNCTVSDGCSHGTHVAGIVAGAGAPDGSAGVAKGASVIAMQVFSWFPGESDVLSWTSDQIKALEQVYALRNTHKIAAVNMSLGGGAYSGTCDSGNTAMKTAIDNLRSAGIATVIATGNDGYRTRISAPACISTAISVGATCDATDGGYCTTGLNGVAGYSNTASFVSLMAPGSTIRSSVPGGGYEGWHGTSMATPHVAGAWAVLKSARPELTVTEALAHLRTNAVTVNDTRSSGTVTNLKRINLAVLPTPTNAYALSVTRQGTGAGTVASSPAGIACGTTCSASFETGTSVTLTATPLNGASFTGWGGACSGTGSTCVVSMSQARSVTASFAAAPVPQWLTVIKQGTGAGDVTSNPAGIACGSTCAYAFTQGTAVTLTASPQAGSIFGGWSGACSGTAPTCTVSMSLARSVTASFRPTPSYALSVARTGTGSGTVASSPAGIQCGTACSATYLHGASVLLNATPNLGSRFANWSGACSGTAPTCTVAMTAARSVTANFVEGGTVALGEAVDNTALIWGTTGRKLWFGQTEAAYAGGDAAHTGLVTHKQTSSLTARVTGPGVVGFWWKVSSQPALDTLRFFMDGKPQAPVISGEVDWVYQTFTVPSGSHTLEWRYTKDGSVSTGSDAGWVDAVTFTPN
jgi:subtilisin family serine protease